MPHNAAPTFDNVVVGNGLAGCAVAARLSERSDVRVTLIEAAGGTRYATALIRENAPS